MKTQNTAAALALAALTLAGATASRADTIANIGMTQTGTTFTFDGTTLADAPLTGNLGLAGIQTAPSIVNPIYFSFGPITETGPVVSNTAAFSGGSFTIYDSTQILANALLTGTFAGSQATIGGSTGSVLNFDSVTYTGGSDLTTFLASHPGSGATGGFSLSLSAVSPTVSVPLNASAFPAFHATGSVGTFDATAVPEPGPIALFAIGGMGLAGLGLRARRRGPVAA
ncbi:MAG: PEP-CTERM sorting domain-containing protein [Armatimonadetes bacterium]|nr:PEP-CTERM sorting domain-containing protein [Armatimonadota bacterium]